MLKQGLAFVAVSHAAGCPAGCLFSPLQIATADSAAPPGLEPHLGGTVVDCMARALQYRHGPTDDVVLFWQVADNLSLQACQAVYFFRNQRSREILYIGKAYRQTIKARWFCQSKARLERLARKEGITTTSLIAGFHTARRITPYLVDDIERLLIFMLQPRWNGPGKASCQLHYRDLVVICNGAWPHRRSKFSYRCNLPFSLTYGSE